MGLQFNCTVPLVGDLGTGKTTLMFQYMEGGYDEVDKNIQGIDEKKKEVTVGSNKVYITMRDTAGQERYRTLTTHHFRKALGVVLVYDITEKNSFESLKGWLMELTQHCPEATKIIIGNKLDLENFRVVSTETAKQFADAEGTLFCETSAKNGTGVEKAFEMLMAEICKRNEDEGWMS